MKNEERFNLLEIRPLIVGAILILIPLLATVFHHLKQHKTSCNIFAFPNPATLDNYARLIADGIGHYF